jgi:uncharacterized membrane-anchored protein
MPSVARLGAVLAIQVAILALVPARQVRARISGTPITLETGPVDPFTPFAGHYIALRYRAEQPPERLVQAGLQDGETVWITAERAEPAWKPISIRRDRPRPAPDQVSIRATWSDWRTRTELPSPGSGPRGTATIPSAGRFYVAAARQKVLDNAMRAAADRQWKELQERRNAGEKVEWADLRGIALVDMRVDDAGDVALMRLRVDGTSADY